MRRQIRGLSIQDALLSRAQKSVTCWILIDCLSLYDPKTGCWMMSVTVGISLFNLLYSRSLCHPEPSKILICHLLHHSLVGSDKHLNTCRRSNDTLTNTSNNVFEKLGLFAELEQTLGSHLKYNYLHTIQPASTPNIFYCQSQFNIQSRFKVFYETSTDRYISMWLF